MFGTDAMQKKGGKFHKKFHTDWSKIYEVTLLLYLTTPFCKKNILDLILIYGKMFFNVSLFSFERYIIY